MKKLLGISLVAALAVAPSLANAAAGDRTVSALNATDAVASANIATTSYVQGAYKAAADQIDALITDTAVAENGNYIDAGKTVSHNLKELDTAVKSLEGTASSSYQLKEKSTVVDDGNGDLHYITAGFEVAANLEALDDQVYANTTAIGDANSGLTKAIADEATTRANADTAINNKIGSLVDGTYTAGQTIGADIDALDTGLNNLAGTVSTLSSTMNSDFATKEGVVATINHSTASGTVAVYDTWNDPHTQNVTVSSTVTSPATNAYYATVSAQSGVTQPVVAPAEPSAEPSGN